MGLFDTLKPEGKYADEFVCSACGKKLDDLQTKDFDCLMATITLKDDGTLETRHAYGDEDEERWRIIKDTRYAHVYTSCDQCHAQTGVRTWNEWRLHVREGKVIEIARILRGGSR